MRNLFWFAAGELAGRSGPSKDPWDLQQLRSVGIGAVLSVNDGECCHSTDIERAGLSYRCVPLSRNAPPEEGDLQHCVKALPEALAYVLQNKRAGRATLVHCHSGKDRTGLFLAYYAVCALGMNRFDAIARVREVRPIAFSAPGWGEFGLEVLAACERPNASVELSADTSVARFNSRAPLEPSR